MEWSLEAGGRNIGKLEFVLHEHLQRLRRRPGRGLCGRWQRHFGRHPASRARSRALPSALGRQCRLSLQGGHARHLRARELQRDALRSRLGFRSPHQGLHSTHRAVRQCRRQTGWHLQGRSDAGRRHRLAGTRLPDESFLRLLGESNAELSAKQHGGVEPGARDQWQLGRMEPDRRRLHDHLFQQRRAVPHNARHPGDHDPGFDVGCET